MANKIRTQIENYMRWYREGHATVEEMNQHYQRLTDLVYRMWQEELISDNVKNECYEVLKDYAWQILKLMH